MPRDYGKVRHRFWTGDTGKEIRAIGLEARVVATYLLTCGSSNMIGLYYLPATLLSHETGIPIEGALKALRSLSEAEFAHYDEASEVVFVPFMAREQIAEELSKDDKQRQGVIALLKEYKKSRFVADFVAIYKEAYCLPDGLDDEAKLKPLPSPIEAPSKPHRSQDQEQEQEHEHEQRAENREQASKPDPMADRIREVHAHHHTHHPKGAPEILPTSKEWRLIRDRLKEGHTVEALCKAVDGYHKSPWHCGKNENGTKYLDLALIMRDQSHVEKGIGMDDAPPTSANGVADQRHGHARSEDSHFTQTGKVDL